MGFLLALLPLRGLHQHSAVARDGVQHAVEFFENILPVANGIDAQDVMKRARHFNRVLMGEDVTHLMAEHAGEFVVSAKEGDHFARDINASGAHAERVHYRGINKDDAKLQLCGRELRENAIRNYVEVIGEFVVMDNAKVLFQPFRFDITQVQFLLRVENVGTGRSAERWRSRAFLLRAHHAGREDR